LDIAWVGSNPAVNPSLPSLFLPDSPTLSTLDLL
jgi:hypothetical protein